MRSGYITRNPAVDTGRNPEPRAEELRPFSREQIDALAPELGSVYGPLVVFAAETGCAPTNGRPPSGATSTAAASSGVHRAAPYLAPPGAGATGLEPATSGVTVRASRYDAFHRGRSIPRFCRRYAGSRR